MGLPERLKQARDEKGWTQEEAADHSGVPTNTISRYESEARRPRAHYLYALAKAYGVSMDWLMSGETPVGLTPEEEARAATISRLELWIRRLDDWDLQTTAGLVQGLLRHPKYPGEAPQATN